MYSLRPLLSLSLSCFSTSILSRSCALPAEWFITWKFTRWPNKPAGAAAVRRRSRSLFDSQSVAHARHNTRVTLVRLATKCRPISLLWRGAGCTSTDDCSRLISFSWPPRGRYEHNSQLICRIAACTSTDARPIRPHNENRENLWHFQRKSNWDPASKTPAEPKRSASGMPNQLEISVQAET